MSYFKGGNIIKRVASTASSAGTIVLSISSPQIQVITGTTTETVQLPDATTCPNGLVFTVVNNSTGLVSVNNSASTLILTLSTEQSADFIVTNNGIANGFTPSQGTGSSAAIQPPQAISGSNIDWSAGSFFDQTLSANTTFTFSNQTPGQDIVVRLTNTGSNFTVTWPVSVKWPQQTTPI